MILSNHIRASLAKLAAAALAAPMVRATGDLSVVSFRDGWRQWSVAAAAGMREIL